MANKLRKWIESHPAPVLVGLAISAGSIASGATAYLSSRLHSSEKAEIQSKFLAEKSELQSKYTDQIKDLTSRLSSIERRVTSGSDKKYFDVQALQISSPEVRNLSSQYRGFDGGHFFINTPISDAWSYIETDELALAKNGLFKGLIELFEKMGGDNAISAPLHAWVSKPSGDSSFMLGGQEIRGKISSYVSIMKVNMALVSKKMSAMAGFLDNPKLKSSLADLSEIVSQIEEMRSGKASGDLTVRNDEKVSAKKGSEIEIFEKFYSGDTAGFVFVDSLVSMSMLSTQEPSISLSIHSAQKQLNVMYIDAELGFQNVKISNSTDQSCADGSSRVLKLRREIFFISYGTDGYVIKTEVPSCDGRSSSFNWVSQWLAGLKVVILRPS